MLKTKGLCERSLIKGLHSFPRRCTADSTPTHTFPASPQARFPHQSGARKESPDKLQQAACVPNPGFCRAPTTPRKECDHVDAHPGPSSSLARPSLPAEGPYGSPEPTGVRRPSAAPARRPPRVQQTAGLLTAPPRPGRPPPNWRGTASARGAGPGWVTVRRPGPCHPLAAAGGGRAATGALAAVRMRRCKGLHAVPGSSEGLSVKLLDYISHKPAGPHRRDSQESFHLV